MSAEVYVLTETVTYDPPCTDGTRAESVVHGVFASRGEAERAINVMCNRSDCTPEQYDIQTAPLGLFSWFDDFTDTMGSMHCADEFAASVFDDTEADERMMQRVLGRAGS